MEFESIESLYSHIETDLSTLNREWELTGAIKRLIDKTTDDALKEKIKWECYAFDFIIREGEVKPVHSSTKEDGTLFAYPSYSDFGDNGLIYLKERSAIVKNDFLVSRYSHLLWKSPAPHKHHQHAKNAVDAYLRIIQNPNFTKEGTREELNRLEFLKNGLKVAMESKHRVDEFKIIISSWLFNKREFSSILKIRILDHVLEISLFKKEELAGALELVRKIGAAYSKKKKEFFFVKDIYETGLTLSQKLGTDPKIWNKRIGENFVRMAESRMDDETRMVPLSFLREAIPYFKLAGLPTKVKEIEHRYFELKKELKLSKFHLPLNEETDEALGSYLNAKAEKLLAAESNEIYGYLLNGADIFPDKKWLVEMVKNRDKTFRDLFTTLRFDINNNHTKEKTSKELKETAEIYENYHLYINLTVLPFLHRIFIEGIKSGKVSFPTLIQFLLHNTWLGQELMETDGTGGSIKYNWLSLLAPSILEYFAQTECALRSSEPYTNYVMPIDSLTLKFEGVLRDFCQILNISTTVTGKGNVLREKYIEELLAEKEIQKYFDENDLLLFKFLFVAKNGMNLRNNIAHCFYRFNNYSFQIMHLLICAFLRIGKYRLKKETKK